jgi:hypothetical protein
MLSPCIAGIHPDRLSNAALAAELTNHLVDGAVLIPAPPARSPSCSRPAFTTQPSPQPNKDGFMSTLTLDGTTAAAKAAVQRSKADTLRIAALDLLSIRFIQRFVYWGGGSRRFIYAPAKLDPNAASWMANKFQSAMPGALLGTDHIIAFLLHHFIFSTSR